MFCSQKTRVARVKERCDREAYARETALKQISKVRDGVVAQTQQLAAEVEAYPVYNPYEWVCPKCGNPSERVVTWIKGGPISTDYYRWDEWVTLMTKPSERVIPRVERPEYLTVKCSVCRYSDQKYRPCDQEGPVYVPAPDQSN